MLYRIGIKSVKDLTSLGSNIILLSKERTTLFKVFHHHHHHFTYYGRCVVSLVYSCIPTTHMILLLLLNCGRMIKMITLFIYEHYLNQISVNFFFFICGNKMTKTMIFVQYIFIHIFIRMVWDFFNAKKQKNLAIMHHQRTARWQSFNNDLIIYIHLIIPSSTLRKLQKNV